MILFERLNERRIDFLDQTHLTDVVIHVGVVGVLQLHAARLNEAAILAGQTHGMPAEGVDHLHEIALHLTAQHPFDNFHRLGISDTHALHEFANLTHAIQGTVDLRTAAVHNHRVHADKFQKHHVSRESALQFRIRHGVAAVLDHDRLAVKSLNVRKSFGKNFSFERSGHQIGVGGGSLHCLSSFFDRGDLLPNERQFTCVPSGTDTSPRRSFDDTFFFCQRRCKRAKLYRTMRLANTVRARIAKQSPKALSCRRNDR